MADLPAYPDAHRPYGENAAAALIVAEIDEQAEAAKRALEAMGYAALRSVDFATAANDPGVFDGLDLILIEGAAAADAAFDLALARADTIARERSLGVIAAILPDQIDAAAAQLGSARSQLLCEPSVADRAAAIALAKWQVCGRLNDAARDADAARLQRLNDEVARIADTLARLTRGEGTERRAGVRAPGSAFHGPDEGGEGATAQEIRAVIRSRRLRAQFFESALFADPAWDMLLDLFAAGLERRRVSVSSLCIAAAVPPTTALRWIGTLHEAGLFERQADPSDRRRAYIALSQKGIDGMRGYVAAARRAGLSIA